MSDEHHLNSSPETSFALSDDSFLNVTRLLVESDEALLGLDVAPRFSWVTVSDQRSVIQQSYRLQVFPDNVTDPIWDSGVIVSSIPYGHGYAGPSLLSDTRYSWTVGVVTNAGEAIGASTLTTGFMDEEEWGDSAWIGKSLDTNAPRSNALSVNGSFWIWTADIDDIIVSPGSRGFRKHIITPICKAAVTADILITADDAFILFVNGARAGSSPVIAEPAFDPAWRYVSRFSVSLNDGDDLLAVHCTNFNGTGNAERSAVGATSFCSHRVRRRHDSECCFRLFVAHYSREPSAWFRTARFRRVALGERNHGWCRGGGIRLRHQ